MQAKRSFQLNNHNSVSGNIHEWFLTPLKIVKNLKHNNSMKMGERGMSDIRFYQVTTTREKHINKVRSKL
jgi:hypothetical protein